MGTDNQQIATQAPEAAHALPRFLSSISEHAKRLDPKLKPFAESALAEAQERLRPVDKREFAGHLGSCLSLVAPSGMAEGERTEWLRAAWITLEGVPADLLSRGCDVARRYADHPSKVVPMILREIETAWQQRKNNRSSVVAAIAKMDDPEDNEPRCDPEEARAIMAKFGIRPEETDEDRAKARAHRGPPIAPDREWYLAHGIDPDAPESPDQAA